MSEHRADGAREAFSVRVSWDGCGVHIQWVDEEGGRETSRPQLNVEKTITQREFSDFKDGLAQSILEFAATLTMEEYERRLERVLAPILDSFPSGPDVRDSDDFFGIDEKAKELAWLYSGSAPDAGADLDWVDLAETLVAEKSKDLQTLAQWVFGLFMKYRFPGLALGLSAYRKIVEEYWDSLWPHKERKRIAAIEFLNNKSFLSRFRSLRPQQSDRLWLEICDREARALNRLLKEEIPVSLDRLQDLIAGLLEFLGKEIPEQPADQETSS